MTVNGTGDRQVIEELEALRQEARYLREVVEQTASRLLTVDTISIAIRHELEQKRRGFRLMAELAVTFGQDPDYQSEFMSIGRRINATLNMQRTAVLFPEGGGTLRAIVLQGYSAEDKEAIATRHIAIDAELLDPLHPVLITGTDPVNRLGSLREALKLPYLIASPIILHSEVVAILITGRLVEQRPYLPRLGTSDVETVQTVTAYLAAMLAGHRLRQAEILAKHDQLTKLPNLRGTTEQLRHTLSLARDGGYFAAAMFIDLDGFKSVNDTYGHAAGDIVLQVVADRLTQSIRNSDFAGRIGGDEFVIVLAHIKHPKEASIVAGKILKKLGEPIHLGDNVTKIGASIGIAIFPDDGGNESALIRAADEAMYTIKNKGKNSFASKYTEFL